jgi:[acyl-carrier-protein] S-malonyltransferase
VTAAPFDDIRRRLAEGVTHPVRWRETLLTLRGRGVHSCIEVGPGKVLTRLVRKTLPGVEAHAADALEPARA